MPKSRSKSRKYGRQTRKIDRKAHVKSEHVRHIFALIHDKHKFKEMEYRE